MNNSNPLKIVGLLFLIGFVVYLLVTSRAALFPSRSGQGGIDFKKYLLAPNFPGASSTAPRTSLDPAPRPTNSSSSSPSITSTILPVGFQSNQLSPLFGKIKISAVSSGSVVQAASVTLEMSVPMDIRGWKIRAVSGGSQVIGEEGQAASGRFVVTLASRFLGANHDRVLLFDVKGLLVADYNY